MAYLVGDKNHKKLFKKMLQIPLTIFRRRGILSLTDAEMRRAQRNQTIDTIVLLKIR